VPLLRCSHVTLLVTLRFAFAFTHTFVAFTFDSSLLVGTALLRFTYCSGCYTLVYVSLPLRSALIWYVGVDLCPFTFDLRCVVPLRTFDCPVVVLFILDAPLYTLRVCCY